MNRVGNVGIGTTSPQARLHVSGNIITEGKISGDGSGLTNLSAASVAGTVPDARLSANVALLDAANLFTGTNVFAGVTVLTNSANLLAGSFSGDGSRLTNLNAANLTGAISGDGSRLTNLSAASLSGTLPDSRLSANVALLNDSNLFTGWNDFQGSTSLTNSNNVYSGTFIGNVGIGTNSPQSTLHVNGNISTTASNRLAITSILVGDTPHIWTNDQPNNVFIFIDGGTVSAVDINDTPAVFTSTGHTIPLQSGEWVTVAYSVPPRMFWKPW